jgi:hypothetical protein
VVISPLVHENDTKLIARLHQCHELTLNGWRLGVHEREPAHPVLNRLAFPGFRRQQLAVHDLRAENRRPPSVRRLKSIVRHIVDRERGERSHAESAHPDVNQTQRLATRHAFDCQVAVDGNPDRLSTLIVWGHRRTPYTPNRPAQGEPSAETIPARDWIRWRIVPEKPSFCTSVQVLIF